MAAYSFVSGTINTYMAGYNIGESLGIGILAGSAGYLGGAFGGALGGGVGTFGGAVLGGAIGGAAGGATYSALTGGNIGRAALAGAAGGAIAGVGGFMGGIFAPAGVLAGGGVGAEIMGGEFSQGVMRSIVAAAGAAITTGNFQGAKDNARSKAGIEGDTILVEEEVSLILAAGSADNPDPGWAAGKAPEHIIKGIAFFKMQHIQRNITKSINRLAANYPMNETFSALIGVDLITDQVFLCQPYQAGEAFIRQPASEGRVYFIKTGIQGRMPEWHAA